MTPWTTSAAGLHSGWRAWMGHPQGGLGPFGVVHLPQQLAQVVGGPRRPFGVVHGDGRLEGAPGRFDVALAGEVVPHQEGALGLTAPFGAHALSLSGPPRAVEAAWL